MGNRIYFLWTYKQNKDVPSSTLDLSLFSTEKNTNAFCVGKTPNQSQKNLLNNGERNIFS